MPPAPGGTAQLCSATACKPTAAQLHQADQIGPWHAKSHPTAFFSVSIEAKSTERGAHPPTTPSSRRVLAPAQVPHAPLRSPLTSSRRAGRRSCGRNRAARSR